MPGPPEPASPTRRYWIPALAVLPIVVLLYFAGAWWRARSASSQIRSVAILPFADRSSAKDQESFCDGITEEVIDAVSRIPGMHVIARTSAFEFKNKPRDLRKTGEQLGVDAILEGAVSKEGDNLRIDLQLTRAADGYQPWTKSFTRPVKDVYSIHQEIAAAFASRVQIANPPAHAAHKPSPDAYTAFLEGRHFFNQSEAEGMTKSVERLEAATALDPEFAAAWAWLSIVREYRVDYGIVRANEAMPASRDAAERAVALDPELAESHLALGIVKLQYDWDWTEAKQELDRAAQLSPESGFILHWRAHWFETQGKRDEAIAEMKRSLALDPLSDVILGEIELEYLGSPHPEMAIPFAQKAVDLYPADATDVGSLAAAFYLSGQKEKAIQMIRALRTSPAVQQVPAFQLASFNAWAGDPSDARQMLAQADDLHENQGVPVVAFVVVAASLKDWDSLFHWLDIGCDERSVQIPYVRIWPEIPTADPRFQALIDRMNLPR